MSLVLLFTIFVDVCTAWSVIYEWEKCGIITLESPSSGGSCLGRLLIRPLVATYGELKITMIGSQEIITQL